MTNYSEYTDLKKLLVARTAVDVLAMNNKKMI